VSATLLAGSKTSVYVHSPYRTSALILLAETKILVPRYSAVLISAALTSTFSRTKIVTGSKAYVAFVFLFRLLYVMVIHPLHPVCPVECHPVTSGVPDWCVSFGCESGGRNRVDDIWVRLFGESDPASKTASYCSTSLFADDDWASRVQLFDMLNLVHRPLRQAAKLNRH
jgi:hypothetical protein